MKPFITGITNDNILYTVFPTITTRISHPEQKKPQLNNEKENSYKIFKRLDK
jgi:hypothetical protein